MIETDRDDSVQLPEGLDGLVKSELASGEILRWAARSEPRPSGLAPRTALQLLIWGLGFWVFATVALLAGTRPDPFWRAYSPTLMVITLIAAVLGFFPMMAAAAGAVASRGEEDRRGRRAVYALTDRRAIIWSPEHGSPGMIVQSFPWSAISANLIRRSQFPDGSGTVYFLRFTDDPSGFVGIQDARRVEWLLRELHGSSLDDRTS